jgi:hypothetical protein
MDTPLIQRSTDLRPVNITVVDVHLMNGGKLIALASVEIDIDGIVLVVHGFQVVRVASPMGMVTEVQPPRFRDVMGVWRRAITLPDELKMPIARTVMEALASHGSGAARFHDT